MNFLVVVCLLIVSASADLKGPRITKVLDKMLDGYDKRVRPNAGEGPTEVTVSAYAINVHNWCMKNNDFKVAMYFRQAWNDPRLVFKTDDDKVETIKLDHNMKNSIWMPDTMLVNNRDGWTHDLTRPNFFLRISSNGDVFVSERLTSNAKCDNKGVKFTVGSSRSCTLRFESYGFDDKHITYKWKDLSESNGKPFFVGDIVHPFNVSSTATTIDHVTLSQGTYVAATAVINVTKVAEEMTKDSERRD